jgi:hypothetical protein
MEAGVDWQIKDQCYDTLQQEMPLFVLGRDRFQSKDEWVKRIEVAMADDC